MTFAKEITVTCGMRSHRVELDVNVSRSELAEAIASDRGSLLAGLDACAQVVEAVTDEQIAQLSSDQRWALRVKFVRIAGRLA